VPEVGHGAWGIGGPQWAGAGDADWGRRPQPPIDLGLNFIDTALAYGEGRSERLVGEVVRKRPETIHVGHQGASEEPDLARARRRPRRGRVPGRPRAGQLATPDRVASSRRTITVRTSAATAPEVHARVERIASDLGISEAEVPETAPRYVLTEPTVSTVIPGKRSKRNVERNIAVTDDQGPDERRREKLHGHRWVRNFYR
jgi:aryl-alcohol dehydrogenase-like predicted oxidoreductase